jgi:hypothetical protein
MPPSHHGRLQAPYKPEDGPLSVAYRLFQFAGVHHPGAFLAGSSMPTPLYALYQTLWGLSAVMITVVFGVYTSR